MTAKLEGSARDRLLAAATELFYAEGIHTVGIDRVIERAGVAKASLYSTFGSKDALVRAYLDGRAEARHQRIARHIARHTTPRVRILAVFDALDEAIRTPGYRGCPFVNASAEGPRDETPVRQVCADTRAWQRAQWRALLHELGAPDPTGLARQLGVLYDGANTAASMDGDLAAARHARDMAATLLDAALVGKPDTKPVSKPRRAKAKTD
jgi:AcrR family transcriptional regulator